MVAIAIAQIPKLKFHEPRSNLPGNASSRNGEGKFTLQFARAYVAQFKSLHHGSIKTSMAYAREIPINGFGIADFVAINWDSSNLPHGHKMYDPVSFIEGAKPTVRAFELKLADWRRAIMQANRYRFFSNASIVVLPADKCAAPLEYLYTFRTIGVGLWGFDIDSNRIISHFTPRPSAPIDIRYKCRAVKLVACASKALPVY